MRPSTARGSERNKWQPAYTGNKDLKVRRVIDRVTSSRGILIRPDSVSQLPLPPFSSSASLLRSAVSKQGSPAIALASICDLPLLAPRGGAEILMRAAVRILPVRVVHGNMWDTLAAWNPLCFNFNKCHISLSQLSKDTLMISGYTDMLYRSGSCYRGILQYCWGIFLSYSMFLQCFVAYELFNYVSAIKCVIMLHTMLV